MKLNTLTASDLIVYEYKIVCDCRNTLMLRTFSSQRAIGMAVAQGWAKVRGCVLCPECIRREYEHL